MIDFVNVEQKQRNCLSYAPSTGAPEIAQTALCEHTICNIGSDHNFKIIAGMHLFFWLSTCHGVYIRYKYVLASGLNFFPYIGLGPVT